MSGRRWGFLQQESEPIGNETVLEVATGKAGDEGDCECDAHGRGAGADFAGVFGTGERRGGAAVKDSDGA